MPQPLRITTGKEMREIDQIAQDEFQISDLLLMENAGRASAQQLFDYYPHAGRTSEVCVLAGKGNNAGDAFVLARRLICLGRKVRVFTLVNPKEYKGSCRTNYEILEHLKAKITPLENVGVLEDYFRSSNQAVTIVDGLIGTGLRGDVSGLFYDVIELINSHAFPEVISLDIPSGINADTGAMHGSAMMATLTISYGFPKLGHFFPPGAAQRGQLVNVDISLPPHFRIEGDKFLLRKRPMQMFLKERNRYGHKNSFGHTLLVGGSPGKIGAISMAARASHKVGTGLVTVATWEDSLPPLHSKLPDETMAVPMVVAAENYEPYKKMLTRYSSVVVGPGLGRRPDGKVVMENLLSMYSGPMVIDADALNLIAEHQLHELLLKRNGPTILTPHPGEMSRLLGISKEEVLGDPLTSVKRCIERTHSVVLLKGAATVIGSTDDVFYLNHYPNDGMATAGSGDVLAGIIGGLTGQGLSPFKAAQLGVYVHSMAGDYAANDLGHRAMTASDIINNIGNAFKDLENINEPDFPEEGRARLR